MGVYNIAQVACKYVSAWPWEIVLVCLIACSIHVSHGASRANRELGTDMV